MTTEDFMINAERADRARRLQWRTTTSTTPWPISSICWPIYNTTAPLPMAQVLRTGRSMTCSGSPVITSPKKYTGNPRYPTRTKRGTPRIRTPQTLLEELEIIDRAMRDGTASPQQQSPWRPDSQAGKCRTELLNALSTRLEVWDDRYSGRADDGATEIWQHARAAIAEATRR